MLPARLVLASARSAGIAPINSVSLALSADDNGKFASEEIDVRLGRRSFVRGNVAHLRENGGVEVWVALPGLEDVKEEIEAVHFGFDDAIVVLLLGRPAAGFDGFEARAKSGEAFRFLRHRGGAVIGPAMDDRGMIEGAPIGEQGRQLLVGRSRRFGCAVGFAILASSATRARQRVRRFISKLLCLLFRFICHSITEQSYLIRSRNRYSFEDKPRFGGCNCSSNNRGRETDLWSPPTT